MRIPAAQAKAANRSIVDCGFPFTITVPTHIPPNTRVTIRFPDSTPPPNFPSLNAARWFGHDSIEPEFHAAVVDATAPKERDGYYWGYDVRVAENLTRLFAACPYDGGYDITIGTSERGLPLSGIIPHTRSKVSSRGYEDNTAPADILPRKFNHALIVFGGVAGLEKALEYDQELQERLGGNRMDVSKAFDFYVNAVPGQGSRTIRSEEAVWVVLGMLDAWIKWAKR
jgi:predicted SPOUT superfamily RNA methylase MTH1